MRILAILTKWILVGLSILLLGYLAVKNIVPNGRFSVSYEFRPTPFISALRPSERLTEFKQGHEQGIIGDPGYFDVRLPSSFENVELGIVHANQTNQKFTVAAFTDRNNWRFRNGDINVVSADNGLLEAQVKFSTVGLDIVNRTITFILGTPEASSENPITIYGINVIATKQPLTLKQIPLELWEKLIQAVRRRL